MPKYQYVCTNCSKEFELRRPRIDARKKASCPDCGNDGKRRISEFAGMTKKKSDRSPASS
jgi:putative FmdB family regulatory protein